MEKKKLDGNIKSYSELNQLRENMEDNEDDEDNKNIDDRNYSIEYKNICLSFTLENIKKINSSNSSLEEENTQFTNENNKNKNIKNIIKNDNIIQENNREVLEILEQEENDKLKKYKKEKEAKNEDNKKLKDKEMEENKKRESININNNNITLKFHKAQKIYTSNAKKDTKKKEMLAIKNRDHKVIKINNKKKIKSENSFENSLLEYHDYTLKINYKIKKKSNQKIKRKILTCSSDEKQFYTISKSSICTHNHKFINYLNDCEQSSYNLKNFIEYKKRKKKKEKDILKKKEIHDNRESVNNYSLNLNKNLNLNQNCSIKILSEFKVSVDDNTSNDKKVKFINGSSCYIKNKNANYKCLNSYSSKIMKNRKLMLKNIANSLNSKRSLSFFPKKNSLGKKKEKIIIFLNHNYSLWGNGKINDHFYKTIHKNDIDNLEEEKIFIDYHKNKKIKKLIYRIFPQFSLFSILLYVSFIQWLIFILLISIKSNFSLTPSDDSLKNFGSNFPYGIFQNLEVYRLFTSLFLHSNFNHICANTYVQLTVGFLLEYIYGTFIVFLLYLFTGIYGIILSSPLTYCYSTTESSSSSSGIIGIFFSEILIMTNFNLDKISISVHLFFFFLLLLFLKFSLNTISINIYSHFFGFVGGFFIGIILKRNQLKYLLKNNLLVQVTCSSFLALSLAAAIFISVYNDRKCTN